MAAKKILVVASNMGVWAEELQAPWDALRNAGHDLTLGTPRGKKPLPLVISVDPDFIDPALNDHVNPKEVCDRTKELVAGEEWAHPIALKDARMDDYDALVLCGGLGAMLDLANNVHLHRLLLDALDQEKLIGSICYAVGALVFCRDPKNNFRSIIHGKTVAVHPREWDFKDDCNYTLFGATPDNQGTDAVTPGFLFPLADLAVDAVGPTGKAIADPTTTRAKPSVAFDWPFVTGCSVESSIAYGKLLVEKLADAEARPGVRAPRSATVTQAPEERAPLM